MLYLLTLICVEINPSCADVTCHHGGSCVYINETSNGVCSYNNNFAGKFYEGTTISEVCIRLM